MSLFKKKENKEESCCCGGNCTPEDMERAEAAKGEGARVKILGSGCAKCQSLEVATKEALTEMGRDMAIDHVTDFAQIAAYGVMTTPALVVDEKVVSYGKVLKKDEVKGILEKTL
jgi:small redox-active disulfide protein 2